MAQFPWPNGAKCAVALTFDEDGECIPLLYDPPNARKRLALQSEGMYGPNVGTPRILDLLDRHGINGTFFSPGFVVERHPELMREIIARGNELGHHGYLHERPDFVDEDEEERIMIRGLEVLEEVTGVRPRGYRSPAWEREPLRWLGINAGLQAMTIADAEESVTRLPSTVARAVSPLLG